MNKQVSQSRIFFASTGGGILLAIIGLCGWLFNSFFLRSIFSDGATMKVNTALLLLLLGTSLLLLFFTFLRSARLVCMLLVVFAILILTEHTFGVNLHIDQWWFTDRDTRAPGDTPGRTSALTAFNCLLVSASILLLSYRHFVMSQCIVVVTFLLAYTSLIGHLFHINGLYIIGVYSGIAVHTSVSLLLLSTGVLFYQPQKGFVGKIYYRLGGRHTTMYTFTYFFCIAPLLVAFYVYIIDKGSFSPAAGIIVLMVFAAIISIPLAYLLLSRMERADADLLKANERLEIVIQAAGMGVWEHEIATGFINQSQRFADILEQPYAPAVIAGKVFDRLHPDDRDLQQQVYEDALASGKLDTQVRLLMPDKSIKYVHVYAAVKYNDERKPTRLAGCIMDVTLQKELEHQKDQFISIASHELKTPVTVIKAHLGMLTLAAQAEENKAKILIPSSLPALAKQVDKLTKLIYSLLDVSRIGNGHLKLQKERFDLYLLVRDVIAAITPSVIPHRIIVIQQEECYVWADKSRIEQVLVNLLTNAGKYSPKASTIELSLTVPRDGSVYVSVTDFGIGIDKHEQGKIFQRFYRVKGKSELTFPGLGIGLFLAAEIVHLHNGVIEVKSEKDRGSTFTFSLPLLES